MDVVLEQYFDFGIMGDEFGFVLDGFWETLQLSFVSGVLALIWGLVLALMRQLPGRRFAPVRGLAIAYIDVFRGIPLLLVVLIISGSAPFVAEGLGLPRSVGIPQWFGKTDPFWYGTLALTITYGAYMAEVYRAGNRGRSARADGGGAGTGHEPRAGDAPRDRPAGGQARRPAAAQRLHRADEGHVAHRGDRAARGRGGRPHGSG